jgi:putative ABC transport system permease protein
MFRRWRTRRSHRIDAFRQEMDSHIDHLTDEHRDRGLTPEDARHAALREFGNVTVHAERHYESLWATAIETLWQDVRYGWRGLWRNAPTTVLAIVALTIGIGVNTALFSVVDTVLLRPLPVAQPQTLMQLRLGDRQWLPFPLVERLARSNIPAFAFAQTRVNLQSPGEPRFVDAEYVSASYFSTLGIRPEVGRLISQANDRAGQPPLTEAVISHRLWTQQYGRDLNVAGQSISIDGHTFTIVGVTPAEFFGLEVGRRSDVFISFASEPVLVGASDSLLGEWNAGWLSIFARVPSADATPRVQGQVQALLGASGDVSAGWATEHRVDTVTLTPAASGISAVRERYEQAVWTLGLIGLLVLAAALVTVANLLVARGEARREEMALRTALGASRSRLVRQLLTENTLLAAIAGSGALLCTTVAANLLVAQVSTPDRPIEVATYLTGTVVICALGLTTLSVFAFGMIPALRGSRVSAEAVKGGERTASGAAIRLTHGLASGQFAVSLALVFAAALLVASFSRLVGSDRGFDTSGLWLLKVDLRRAAVTPDDRRGLPGQVVERVRSVPSVVQAAGTVHLPTAGWMWMTSLEGSVPVDTAPSRQVFLSSVSDSYFQTFGISVTAGREFHASEPPGTAIVNESFATRFFANVSPIGRTVSLDKREAMIVGIVRDTRYRSLRDQPPPMLYIPLSQQRQPRAVLHVIVRPQSGSGEFVSDVRASLRTLDDQLGLDMRPLETQIRSSVVQEEALARLAAAGGVIAVVLAAIGIYGVLAFGLRRRQREFGIRLAIGATGKHLQRLVFADLGRIALAGVIAGTALSLMSARLVKTLLFDVAPWDPGLFAVAMAVLLVSATGAAYGPARRARRLNPVEIIRGD